MIKLDQFYHTLVKNGLYFFCGVPDSLLKDFCAYIHQNSGEKHVIAANEGSAVAMAAGHYIATGNPAVVYMQNSGIGNAVNPLLSLTDKDVYGIPLLLIIGWRGEPGIPDEPQHIKQGKVTLALLESIGIEYEIVNSDFSIEKHFPSILKKLNSGKQFALVVRKGSFEKYALTEEKKYKDLPLREEAIKILMQNLPHESRTVATTGMISRELFEYRVGSRETHENDFLSIGSMGHASQIALVIAMNKPEKKVFCLDGDGSIIMHMGNLCINGSSNAKNFYHIVFNNAAHDSVGGQPTAAENIDLSEIAKASGYAWVKKTYSVEALQQSISSLISSEGPAFLEIIVKKGARPDLGRPTISPKINLKDYMKHL